MAFMHSNRWRYILHPDKCVALTYGDTSNSKFNFKLGEENIKNEITALHVGIPLSTSGNVKDHIARASSNGKRKMYSLFGLGSKSGGLTPIVSAKLYNSFSIPTMLYGDQIIDYKRGEIEQLEVTQRQICRRIQFLPKNSSNPTSIMPLGIMPIQMKIMYDRLLMFFGILCLPMNNIYKQLMLLRLTQIVTCSLPSWNSPISRMWQCVQRFNLEEAVIEMLTSAIFPTKPAWKLKIRDLIGCEIRRDFRTTSSMYNRHEICQNICDISETSAGLMKPTAWWTLSRLKPELLIPCKNIMRLATDCHDLRVKNSGINCICVLCDFFEIETIDHFLNSCNAYSDEHAKLTLITRKYINAYSRTSVLFAFNEVNVDTEDMIEISKIILSMTNKRSRMMRAYVGNTGCS
ncbi:unnamed protein product [Owenia fusiformis]|uniref:Uncharacterized protein n=1 Tax=Owenia fusiformis TaxID=6347 RepID=A0A8S4NR18_OWEFU|nr:unnamed protein product [Owenia fusiformis]